MREEGREDGVWQGLRVKRKSWRGLAARKKPARVFCGFHGRPPAAARGQGTRIMAVTGCPRGSGCCMGCRDLAAVPWQRMCFIAV